MRQIAIVRVGDRRTLLPYATIKGFHRFWHDDQEHIVPVNAAIPPETWTGYDELLAIQDAPASVRRHLRREAARARLEGIQVRHFEQIEDSFTEVPLPVVAQGWRSFLQEVHAHAVHRTPDGQVERALVAATASPGNFAAVGELQHNLDRIDPNAARLVQQGVPLPRAEAFLNYLVDTARTGHATTYVQEHVLNYLLPRPEQASILAIAAAYAFWVGLEIGSTTAIGNWYAGTSRGWVLLVMLGLLGAGYALFTRRPRA